MLRLILSNMGIRSAVTGIYAGQCMSSAVRSLADESFQVFDRGLLRRRHR